MQENLLHVPVMLPEVLNILSPKNGGIYIDATFGAGGYTTAILKSANCSVIAIDRDPNAIQMGQKITNDFKNRLTLIEGNFGNIKQIIKNLNLNSVDGVVFDIGVSSMQIDNPNRGFSFQKNGELDMRMSGKGLSAADVVNNTPEDKLANIIYEYGEEKMSRKIAHAIVSRRKEKPFSSTLELAEVVCSVVPRSKDGINPATRTFQALRIHVNDELGELKRGLAGAIDILAPQGKIAVVCFHSLEDRIVKSFLQEKAGKAPRSSRHLPYHEDALNPILNIITKSPLLPTEQEVLVNPRARSARLRAAQKIKGA